MYRDARYSNIKTSNTRKAGDAHMAAKFELYKDPRGEFRWRLIASNGQMIAHSGEGYKSKDSARNGIESVKKSAASATIEDKAQPTLPSKYEKRKEVWLGEEKGSWVSSVSGDSSLVSFLRLWRA